MRRAVFASLLTFTLTLADDLFAVPTGDTLKERT